MDLLGIKVEEGQLRMIHIETGISNRLDLSTMKQKFSSATRSEIQSIADNLGFAENYLVKRWYVHAWGKEKGRGKKWKQTKRELERDEITLMTFEEFLMKTIDAIGQWKEEHKSITGHRPSLPKNLWLLKMLEALLLSGRLVVPVS